MLQKNKQKLDAKRRRNIWTCCRPVTQITPNKKRKSRQQLKRELKLINSRYYFV